jgi:hypothetical protein
MGLILVLPLLAQLVLLKHPAAAACLQHSCKRHKGGTGV